MEKEIKFSGNIYETDIEKGDIIEFFTDLVESGLSHRIADVEVDFINVEVITYSVSDEEDFDEKLSDWFEDDDE